MPEPVILEAIRIPFGKRAGVYRETRQDALLAHTLCGLLSDRRRKIAGFSIGDDRA